MRHLPNFTAITPYLPTWQDLAVSLLSASWIEAQHWINVWSWASCGQWISIWSGKGLILSLVRQQAITRISSDHDKEWIRLLLNHWDPFLRYMNPQTSGIRITLAGNKNFYHSNVVGAAPIGAARSNYIFILDIHYWHQSNHDVDRGWTVKVMTEKETECETAVSPMLIH